MPPGPRASADLRRLYHLPLAEFTAARNALASELRAAGRRAEADEARRLAKPSASAWAVTRVLQEEEARVRALRAAGARAREQSQPEKVRSALEEVRRLEGELRGAAAEILAAGGQAASEAVLERVAGSLRALAFAPEAAAAAERGWLDQDLEPPGFDVLASLQLAAQAAPAASRPAPARGAPPRTSRGKTAPAAQRAADRKAAALVARRAAIAAAERELEQARARADFQRRRAERATLEAEASRRRVAEVQRQVEEAERAARAAREGAAEAEAALTRARRAFDAARAAKV